MVFSAFELVDLLICLIGPSEFRLKLEFEQRIGRRRHRHRHRPNVDIGNIFEMGLPPKKSKTNGTDVRRSKWLRRRTKKNLLHFQSFLKPLLIKPVPRLTKALCRVISMSISMPTCSFISSCKAISLE